MGASGFVARATLGMDKRTGGSTLSTLISLMQISPRHCCCHHHCFVRSLVVVIFDGELTELGQNDAVDVEL